MPGIYVLTGTELEQAAARTGRERTLTTTLIVRPWAYIGLSEDFSAGWPATARANQNGAGRSWSAVTQSLSAATTSSISSVASTTCSWPPKKYSSLRPRLAATSALVPAAREYSTPAPTPSLQS